MKRITINLNYIIINEARTRTEGSSCYFCVKLSRMKKFYEKYKDLAILPPAVAKLPWMHNCILLDIIKDDKIRNWYAEKCLKNGWSKTILDHQIDLQLYERQIIS